MPQQMFVDLKETNLLQRLKYEQSVTVKRVTLNNSDCKSTPKTIEIDSDSNEEGFYQIVRKDFKPKTQQQNAAHNQNVANPFIK